MGKRFESIDQFRGFAIVAMVVANYLGGVEDVPRWLQHVPDIGLTVIDLVAPLFILAIGLTYGLSMHRRLVKSGPRRTFAHFVRRFMALLGIGALIAAGGAWFGFEADEVGWGVLQAIGVAGLLALPFVRLPIEIKLAAGIALLGTYQVLLDRFWLEIVLNASHGGIWGALAWGAMLILALVLGDLFHAPLRERRLFPWAALAAVTLGIVLSLYIPVSKNRVSASYVLISLGIGGLVFYGFFLLGDRLRFRFPLLSAWGRNPLLIYLLHYLLLGIFALPRIPGWYAQAPSWLTSLQLLFILGILSWVGWYLARKNWILAL